MTIELQQGLRVGNYLLQSKIGEGAFSVVWEATHCERQDRVVAIKIATDPAFRRQLGREARLPEINHPNVVPILDSDTRFADFPYIVIPYYSGGNLATLIGMKPFGFPSLTVKSVFVDMLRGLAAAHGRGIIHRDVKPSNVLLDSAGRALIADFGLSLAPDVSGMMRSMTQSVSLERDSAQGFAGTLAYMAPEIRDGATATPAADVFSAGIVLFEMLTGQRPCGAEKPSEVRSKLRYARQWDQLFIEVFCSQRRRIPNAQQMLARYFELFEAPSLSDASTSARQGDLGKVADFVFAHPELIDTCPEGSGLLHNAARNGRQEVAALLLDRGASVNAMDQQHETPLHFAARWNRELMTKFLLVKGSNPNSSNKSGVTPLHYAAKWGYRDVAQALLSGGAVPVATRRGVTPLHWAARWGHLAVAELLASKGNVNAKTQDAVLPLHLAARSGHAAIVSMLLKRGAEASPQTISGWAPLHFAVRRGSAEIVELLLDAGANSMLRGGTQIGVAHAEWLGQKGTRTGFTGYTSIELAESCYCMNPAIARILLERSRK